MKTYFKNPQIILWLLASSLFLSVSQIAFGQEMIREVVNLHDDYSLVRETDRGEWLVYNYNSGRSIFSLVTDTTASAPQMYLDYPDYFSAVKVLDFTIFQDTVYFCGLVYEDNEEYYATAWGYFPLLGFPHDSVFIETGLYYMQHFNNIAVFSVDGSMTGLHVLMTCNEDTLGFFNSIIDLVRITPNCFNSYTHRYDESSKYYDDIEVTDHNVIFSYRQKSDTGSQRWTYLNYVTKPSTSGITIFSNVVRNQRLSDRIPMGRSLLEYCTNDAFVVAQPIRDSINVFAFELDIDGKYVCLGAVRFFRRLFYEQMKDIKYDRQSRILDILTVYNSIQSSQLYHFNPMLLGSGGTIYVHRFRGEILNSLDVLRFNPDYFIASGHNSESSNLRLYRYRYFDNKDCTEYLNVMSDFFEYSEKPKEIFDDLNAFKIYLKPLRAFELTNPVKTVCGK